MVLRRFLPLFTRQNDAYKGKGFDVLETQRPEGRKDGSGSIPASSGKAARKQVLSGA